MLLKVKDEVSTELQTKKEYPGSFTEVKTKFKHISCWTFAGSVHISATSFSSDLRLEEFTPWLRRVGLEVFARKQYAWPLQCSRVCKHAQTFPSTGSFGEHKSRPYVSIYSVLPALTPPGSWEPTWHNSYQVGTLLAFFLSWDRIEQGALVFLGE